MLGLAQQAGHELTQDAADADVLVVNTCAFIDKSKQESIDTILEMAQYKKDGACTRLIVTGCMAERYRDELRAQIPEIDAVLGTGEVPEIVKAIGSGGVLSARCEVLGAVPGASAAPLAFHRAAPSTAPGTQHPARHPAPGTQHPAPTLPTYLYDADNPRLLATPKNYPS